MKTSTRINKLGSESNYMVLDELPSKQRSYHQINKILVRGLFFDEVKSLSKYISSSSSLRQLVNSYRDVIILQDQDNNEYPIETLEMVDFHYLMITSTLLSTENPQVDCEYLCTHCGEYHKTRIKLENVSYDVPFTDLPDGKVPVEDVQVHPMSVRDLIQVEDFELLRERFRSLIKFEFDSDIFKDLLEYAVILDWENEKDLFKNIIRLNSNGNLLRQIIEVYNQLDTKLDPIKITCPSCNKTLSLKFDFTSLRGYL